MQTLSYDAIIVEIYLIGWYACLSSQEEYF